MKTLVSKSGVEIKIYTSADELTIQRYIKFQKYLVLECSAESLVSKIERSLCFLEEGDLTSTKSELNNAIKALNSMYDGIGYYGKAFACIVAQIGLKVATDLSDAGLDAVISELEHLKISMSEVKEYTSEVKKK